MATLLGPDGRPIRKETLTRELAAPTLTGVRQIVGGHPAAGLTPARLGGLLRAAEQGDATAYLELAEDMEERDLHYASVLGTRKRAIAQLDITVEAASDSAEEERHAELVREFLAREEIEDELVDILDAIGKGFSATEIIWETSLRQWMPRRLEWRQPQWFRFDRGDGRTLRLIDEHGAEVDLPPFKFITHIAKAKSGLAIRGGLARAVAWLFLFKSYGVKDWVQFAEVYGQPLRVGKYGPGATEDERRVLLRAVASIGTDAAAIIPESMLIEFHEAQKTGSTELYQTMLDWFDRQVSKAVLGQTMTTDDGSSLSQAQVHDAVRQDIERADAKQLAATLNQQLVQPLVALNFGPQPWYPRLRIGRPETADIPRLADALSKLVPLGLRVRQAEVRRKLALEEPDEEDELLSAPVAAPVAPPVAPPGAPMTRGCPVHGLAAHRQDAAPDSIDAAIDAVLAGEGWEPLLEPVIAPVLAAADAAGDLADLDRRLAETLAAMDTNRLAELLARLRFSARLAGEGEAPIVERAAPARRR